MALASLLGGLALANAGLGAVHGFAAPIGGMFPAPHGAVCAALLPHVMAANIRALRERAPESAALARYETVARLLTGKAGRARRGRRGVGVGNLPPARDPAAGDVWNRRDRTWKLWWRRPHRRAA